MEDRDQERQLLRGVIAGSEADFRKIYDQYRNKLYTYGLKFTKDEDAAEEIVHLVFLKIWTGRTTINPDLCFNAYLFKITRHLALNYLKKLSQSECLKQKLYHYFDRFHTHTEDTVIYNDYTDLMAQAVDMLPPQRKRVFKMHRSDGMSYKEIAEELRLSKGTVKNHMILSLKFLRSYLSSHTDVTFLYVCLCQLAVIC